MLAFSKDITQSNPSHPEESNNTELKEYMDYQRTLNHEQLIYHALNHAKTNLQSKMNEFESDQEKLEDYLKVSFPVSHSALKSADTIIFMLRKLINGHNSTNNWYRMNTYYYALVYDCMNIFVKFFNGLIQEAPEKAEDYNISGGMEVDFDDWAHLYFPDMDFHIGKELEGSQYPFAKRNKAIEESISKEINEGKPFEEALQEIKGKYEIEDVSISFLLNNEIGKKDMELFYTSTANPIYEYLTEREDGSWGAVDGESLLDQAYYLGSTLKVWVWRKKEDVASAMKDTSDIIKK